MIRGYLAYDYKVQIDAPAADTPVKCGDCGWTGTYADVNEIVECILTPGDASPAGRCPCSGEALCYVDTPATRLADAAPALKRLLTELLDPPGGFTATIAAEAVTLLNYLDGPKDTGRTITRA